MAGISVVGFFVAAATLTALHPDPVRPSAHVADATARPAPAMLAADTTNVVPMAEAPAAEAPAAPRRRTVPVPERQAALPLPPIAPAPPPRLAFDGRRAAPSRLTPRAVTRLASHDRARVAPLARPPQAQLPPAPSPYPEAYYGYYSPYLRYGYYSGY